MARFRSLKSKLLIGVFSLVIGAGLCISILVSQRYSESLYKELTAQAENIAQAVALQAADKILINDLMALQKMLDHQVKSHPDVAYIFVVRDGEVLVHTFETGIPKGLIGANPLDGLKPRLQEVASKKGERFLDMAWPIFEGKAGVLRLGVSEEPYRRRMTKLWLEMSLMALGILVLALGAGLLFVGRITKPLAVLAKASQKIDQGEMGVRVPIGGQDEVGALAASFNHMVARIEDYTSRLEEQTMELEKAHHQTRLFCNIVQGVGSLSTLDRIGSFLIERFMGIVDSKSIVLLTFNANRDVVFRLSRSGTTALRETEAVETAAAVLQRLDGITSSQEAILTAPLVPADFEAADRQSIVPYEHGGQVEGALVLACAEGCRCEEQDLGLLQLIMSQAAGVIKRAIAHEEEIRDLQKRFGSTAEFRGIIGKDPKMQVIYQLIEDVAPTDATVLIQGESGTGKELVARAIHSQSPRSDKPFVVINCSAYPATLLESELFGHEKGAFTGATRQKKGRFELAHGGTVFLDEVGEIPLPAQVRLLRVLQTQKFERLGGEKTMSVDVRVLAATNKNLLEEVKAGAFREDLYYRLNVIPINLPPLRERRNDIPLLARHFLKRFTVEQGKDIRDFSPDAMRLLLGASWPGNVRELENTIEHATVLAKGERIEPGDLPSTLTAPLDAGPRTMVDHEKGLLQDILEECGWNKAQAAKRLGISRSTLYQKIKKYGLVRPTAH